MVEIAARRRPCIDGRDIPGPPGPPAVEDIAAEPPAWAHDHLPLGRHLFAPGEACPGIRRSEAGRA